jgi:pyruvate/2-oxoglutarate dehydrogenase complex dihydrolipoamide dehydrogenase (E3) component
VVQNALFFGRKKMSDLKMPWCTYTDPEIAHVGLYAHDAEAKGIAIDTYTVSFEENDRAMADGEPEGFVKVHTQKGTDTILGATIVARQAGDMINEITLAMVAGIGLKTISEVIHPYPTQGEAIARVAGLYTRTRLTPTVQKLSGGWLTFNRR